MSKEKKANLGIFIYTDKSGVLSSIETYLSLLKDDDYLVIIRDGNLYTIQNSNAKLLAMSKEKIEEAVRRGDVKREEIEEVERRSKELGLDKLVLKTIKVLRYEPRKI